MGSNKKSKDQPNLIQKTVAIAKRLPGGALIFAVIPLLIFGYLGWYYYGAEHLDEALYAIELDDIAITPTPEWVKADIRDEVYQIARLDRLSILDQNANATIAQAFEGHPWVKSTIRVSKLPGGGISVDLVYRRPLAMVYCEPRPLPDGTVAQDASSQGGFFPIDDSGIVLPVADFDKSQTREYMWIFAKNASFLGDIGMPFGDPRITEATKLASFLEDERRQLNLRSIRVDATTQAAQNPLILSLGTQDNLTIKWGHSPGSEAQAEPSAASKFERLVRWLKSVRTGSNATSEIDLSIEGLSSPVSSQRF